MDDFEQKLAQAFDLEKKVEEEKAKVEAQKRQDDIEILKRFEVAIESQLLPVLNASKRQAEKGDWKCTVSHYAGPNPRVVFQLTPAKTGATSTLHFEVTQARQQMAIHEEIEGARGLVQKGTVERLTIQELNPSKAQEVVLAFFDRVFAANR